MESASEEKNPIRDAKRFEKSSCQAGGSAKYPIFKAQMLRHSGPPCSNAHSSVCPWKQYVHVLCRTCDVIETEFDATARIDCSLILLGKHLK